MRSYSTAFIAGDGASARSQLTARCEERIGDLVESGATTIAEQYPGATMTSYEADVDGGAATVTYTFDQPGIDQADERWVVEGGEWRYDDC